MVNQQFHSLPSSLPIAGFLWALPACQDLSFFCLSRHQFSPLDLWAYIILSYGHFQPDWCQLSLKWQCCGVRNSAPWSSVLVPWSSFCQYFLPNLDTTPLSRAQFWLFLMPRPLSEHGIYTDSFFIRALHCHSWHFQCCSITPWSCNGWKNIVQKPLFYFW